MSLADPKWMEFRARKKLEQSLAGFEQLSLDKRSPKEKPRAPSPHQSPASEAPQDATVTSNPFDDDFEDGDQKHEEARREEAQEAEEKQEAVEILEFVQEVDRKILNLFLRFGDAYQALFIHRPDVSPDERTTALRALDNFAVAIFKRYGNLIQSHILVPIPSFPLVSADPLFSSASLWEMEHKARTHNAGHVMEALRVVQQDLQDLINQLEELSLQDFPSDLITQTGQQLIQKHFQMAQEGIRGNRFACCLECTTLS